MSTTATPPRHEHATPPRRPARTGGILIGAVLLLVGLAGTAATAWSYLGETHETTQHHSYARAATHIVTDLEAGDLTVVSGPAGTVDVERRLRWSTREPQIDERWDGDTLQISAQCPGLFINRCAASYVLTVPEGVTVRADGDAGDITTRGIAGALELSSDAGDIAVTGARAAVSAESNAGNIDVAGASGPLTLDSDAGDISATGLTGAMVDATSSAGSIELRFDTAPQQVVARTSAGDLDVTVPRDAAGYQVTADTSSGDPVIDVVQDPASARTIDLDTSAGDITLRHP